MLLRAGLFFVRKVRIMGRLLAVGDIHGRYDKLLGLMDKVRFDPHDDTMVFLGDYIDTGPQPIECMDYVMGLQERCPDSVIPLMGNHELFCLSFYGRNDRMPIGEKGRASLAEWAEAPMSRITREAVDGLDRGRRNSLLGRMSRLRAGYRKDGFCFAHAGVDIRISWERQKETEMVWSLRNVWENYDGRFGVLVMGHMPVQKLDERFWVNGRPLTAPLFLDNVIMCDTGCSMGGCISCVDVLSRHYWQC